MRLSALFISSKRCLSASYLSTAENQGKHKQERDDVEHFIETEL
jgi:hypothetical protein